MAKSISLNFRIFTPQQAWVALRRIPNLSRREKGQLLSLASETQEPALARQALRKNAWKGLPGGAIARRKFAETLLQSRDYRDLLRVYDVPSMRSKAYKRIKTNPTAARFVAGFPKTTPKQRSELIPVALRVRPVYCRDDDAREMLETILEHTPDFPERGLLIKTIADGEFVRVTRSVLQSAATIFPPTHPLSSEEREVLVRGVAKSGSKSLELLESGLLGVVGEIALTIAEVKILAQAAATYVLGKKNARDAKFLLDCAEIGEPFSAEQLQGLRNLCPVAA